MTNRPAEASAVPDMPPSSRRIGPRIAAAIGLAASLAVAALAGSPARAGESHAVAITDFAFAPGSLMVEVGDTVTWTNNDPVVHTATATNGAFDTGDLATGASYPVTFTAPGAFDYFCEPHPSMTGVITVVAAAGAPSSPGPRTPNTAIDAIDAWPAIPLSLGALVGLGLLAQLVRVARRR
jgi:plastocyanin